MTSPKAALEAAADLIVDCVPDDLVEKSKYLRQLQAAIPAAELEGQAMELLPEIRSAFICLCKYAPVIEGKIDKILTQREALK